MTVVDLSAFRYLSLEPLTSPV